MSFKATYGFFADFTPPYIPRDFKVKTAISDRDRLLRDIERYDKGNHSNLDKFIDHMQPKIDRINEWLKENQHKWEAIDGVIEYTDEDMIDENFSFHVHETVFKKDGIIYRELNHIGNGGSTFERRVG